MASAGLGVGAVILAALAASAAHPYVRRGDVVLTQSNGLVRLDADTGVAYPIPIEPPLHEPTGLLVLPDGDLLVADWALPAVDAGSVVRVRVLDAVRFPVATGPPLVTPFALARGPEGRILLADIDAGTRVPLPRAVLRKGVLFELEPSSGGLVRRVEDCCDWNPVAMVLVAPDRLLVADAGCCAYGGAGQLADADLVSGRWRPLRTASTWRDPFALAVSGDGQTLYVAESAAAEPGPPAVRAVDLQSEAVTTLVEGPPLVMPTGLLLEDERRLLVADRGSHAVLRIDVPTGRVTALVSGEPLHRPATLTRVDAGDVVSGVRPAGRAGAACAARAARDADRFVGAVLRCRARGSEDASPDCAEVGRRHRLARPAPGTRCAACVDRNRMAVARILLPTLLRTPGRRLACAGALPGPRVRLARGAARFYRQRSRCAAAHVQAASDASRLRACQDEAEAVFLTRVRGLCDPPELQLLAAEVASLADALLGSWYCGR